MTTLPKEFPRTEIQQVLDYTNGNDIEKDRLVLAIYGLLGNVLAQLYPNAALSFQGNDNLSKDEAIKFKNNLQNLININPHYAEALNYIAFAKPNQLENDIQTGKLPEFVVPVIYKLVEVLLAEVFQSIIFKIQA